MKKKSITHLFVQLGEILQKNRIKSGFSKEKVYEKTHISVETIEQIENGELSDIPNIYLKDFINRYSTFLEIQNDTAVEEFLSCLDQNSKKIPKIKKENVNKKPVRMMMKTIIPVLLIIILLQVLLIQKQKDREIVKITNRGNSEVILRTNGDTIPLKPNETLTFEDNFSGKVINTEKSLIVVEYYEDTWEVFFKEFEVLIGNGQDS